MSAARPTALLQHRWLLYELARREISNRYAGSAGGLAWTILQPLAQLAIFAFVFSQVFRATVPAEYTGITYTAFVAAALWPWIMFSESVQRGMAAVAGNAGLIRKVALPSELFVYAAVLACYAIHLAGFAGVLVVLRLMGENIHLTAIPVALLLIVPYLLLATGIALALGALQTLLKDVEHGTGLALTIVFYATPILYPLSIVPESWRGALQWSPLAYLSERLREVLLMGPSLRPADAIVAIACVVVFAAGLWVFRRLAPYFEDFL
jgi:homopolymeric O-antigen transport system permease protein